MSIKAVLEDAGFVSGPIVFGPLERIFPKDPHLAQSAVKTMAAVTPLVTQKLAAGPSRSPAVDTIVTSPVFDGQPLEYSPDTNLSLWPTAQLLILGGYHVSILPDYEQTYKLGRDQALLSYLKLLAGLSHHCFEIGPGLDLYYIGGQQKLLPIVQEGMAKDMPDAFYIDAVHYRLKQQAEMSAGLGRNEEYVEREKMSLARAAASENINVAARIQEINLR